MRARLRPVKPAVARRGGPGAVVVIGNFDGVHQGHQAVLAAVSRVARARGLRPTMLTFQPHPAVTLGRDAPALLTALPRKLELVERSCPGIQVVVREFTLEFARQTPAEFAQGVLAEELGAAVVMVGLNFRFGCERSGGFGDLERFGAELGFEAIAEPLVSDQHGPWSSSRIRELVAAGDVDGAASLLGRPHMLTGPVVVGDQRGRQLGFPTCNLSELPEALPAFGVYAALVDLVEHGGERAEALARGVANVGVRPTLDRAQRRPLVEVHLFDLRRELYGRGLRIHLISRLRSERRFPGLDALRRQIADDGARARELLAPWEPDPIALGAWA
jgi:riboflavin kinase/FMN adenylyltransferase